MIKFDREVAILNKEYGLWVEHLKQSVDQQMWENYIQILIMSVVSENPIPNYATPHIQNQIMKVRYKKMIGLLKAYAKESNISDPVFLRSIMLNFKNTITRAESEMKSLIEKKRSIKNEIDELSTRLEGYMNVTDDPFIKN